MDEQAVLREFEAAKAILRGHFILSSGLHADTYMQCARVLMDAKRSEKLCAALAELVRYEVFETIDIIISPAMGGVVVGYEMGRQLGVPAIFCERSEGEFVIRRGFDFLEGARVLVVEDVVTTGKSSLEAINCILANGGNVIAEACLVNRSGGNSPLGQIPLISLLDLDIKTYSEDNLPDELSSISAVKLGSRWLVK